MEEEAFARRVMAAIGGERERERFELRRDGNWAESENPNWTLLT